MEILYRDDRVVVCVKPAGILATDEPGGMPELLRQELGEGCTVKSVHRLDRAVSGVMVYALTKRAASDLGEQIIDGRFRKEYLAVVHGQAAGGELRDWLLRDRSARLTRVVPEGTPGAQEAVLRCEPLAEREDMTLLRVDLLTGRTHQIRCQLASRGLPIVGDRKYGRPDGAETIALWSHKIDFIHPRTNEKMTFSHKMPYIYPRDRFCAEKP